MFQPLHLPTLHQQHRERLERAERSRLAATARSTRHPGGSWSARAVARVLPLWARRWARARRPVVARPAPATRP
jgi:hypothetical protein